MVNKPLRILTFVFSAFLVLAFTAGVTHAAGLIRSAQTGGVKVNNSAYPSHSLAVDPSTTPDPSETPEPSQTPEPTQTSESKVEFSGVITAIDLEWWTIGDYVVQVTADTEIEGSPVVGDTVSVEAVLQPDGSYIAHEISMHADSMEEDSEDSEHMTGTPENEDSYEDHGQVTSTPEMHDDQGENEDQHEENGSGSHDEHHDGGSGDHNGGGSGDHSGGDD